MNLVKICTFRRNVMQIVLPMLFKKRNNNVCGCSYSKTIWHTKLWRTRHNSCMKFQNPHTIIYSKRTTSYFSYHMASTWRQKLGDSFRNQESASNFGLKNLYRMTIKIFKTSLKAFQTVWSICKRARIIQLVPLHILHFVWECTSDFIRRVLQQGNEGVLTAWTFPRRAPSQKKRSVGYAHGSGLIIAWYFFGFKNFNSHIV